MLIQQHSGGNGFGYGFGAAGLTQGKDFNCNATICYGIGTGPDAVFRQLQQAINTLSGIAGIAPIGVDGFIGAGTVAALRGLAKAGYAGPYTTKEAVAANASAIIDILTGLAGAAQAAGKQLSPSGGGAGSAAAAAALMPMPTSSSIAAKLPAIKSKTLWWIAGGLAAAMTVGGVGYVVYRRKAR